MLGTSPLEQLAEMECDKKLAAAWWIPSATSASLPFKASSVASKPLSNCQVAGPILLNMFSQAPKCDFACKEKRKEPGALEVLA